MHIELIHIGNFQSHRDTVMKFDRGVNAIIGETDVGKSAIIRAIQWVFRNKPDGESNWNTEARKAGETCWVQIDFRNDDDTKFTVIRERGKDTNSYTLIDEAGESETYTGFVRNVPREIEEKLGSPTSFGDKIKADLTISKQGEQPFLISSHTPKEFAAILGKLTGILVLDLAEKAGNKKITRVKTEIDVTRGLLSQAQEELAALPLPEPIREAVNAAEEALDGVRRMETRMAGMQTARDRIMSLRRESSIIDAKVIQIEPLVEEALKALPVEIATRANQLSLAARTYMGNEDRASDAKAGVLDYESKLVTARECLREYIALMDICPYSGGELFDACKDRIQE